MEACGDGHDLAGLRLKDSSGALVTGGPPEAGGGDGQRRGCSGGTQAREPPGSQVSSWSSGQRRGPQVPLWGSGTEVGTDALRCPQGPKNRPGVAQGGGCRFNK